MKPVCFTCAELMMVGDKIILPWIGLMDLYFRFHLPSPQLRCLAKGHIGMGQSLGSIHQILKSW